MYSESSLKNRIKQAEETREVYIPLAKMYRNIYWEDDNFYPLARTMMTCITNEVDRCDKEELLDSYRI